MTTRGWTVLLLAFVTAAHVSQWLQAWIDEEYCAQGIRCLDSYCKEWDEKHGTYKSQPVHNWASHGSDALQTGACGYVPDYIPPPNDRYYRRPRPQSAWTA